MGSSVIALLIAMLSIQAGATAAKTLFPVVGAVGATVLRLTLASFMLLLLWPPKREKLNRKTLLTIARYGASLGFMNFCFYLALEKIPLGITVALEFTGPLSVALFASRKTSDFLWAVLAIAGILLIVPISPDATGTLDPIGIAYALGAGFFWAMYIVFGQKVGKAVDGKTATSMGMLVATLVVIPLGALYASLGNMAPLSALSMKSLTTALPLALLVALLSSALPYSLEMVALQKMPTKTFGIFMSLEPVLAALCGLIFLQEHLSWTQWSAISCIIAASLGSTLSARQDQREKSEKAKAKSLLEV